jgi:hypothetical protein
MKNYITILSVLVVFCTACKKEEDSTPLISIDPSEIIFDAHMGEIVPFKITATAPDGIKQLKITYKEPDTFTQTLLDSTLSGGTNLSMTYEFKIPAKSTDYTFDIGFICTDNNGKEFSAGRRINVTAGNAILTEYSGNIFYSKNSGQGDSYDLINRTTLFSGIAAASVRDLQNDGTYDSGDSLARGWVSPSGAKFVRFNSYDYPNATYSTLVNTYEAGIKLDTIRDLQTGDLLFTKVTRNNIDSYQVIKVTSIVDQTGSANDLYIFSLKK